MVSENGRQTVLFVSHSKQQCGVYQFGHGIATVLENSSRYRFLYRECESAVDLREFIERDRPTAAIFNHHPSTMPWFHRKLARSLPMPLIGIFHEITQETADRLDQSLFHYHVAADPTLILRNRIVFKTGRLVPSYRNRFEPPDIPTIGSFGFATHGKGFQRLVHVVCEEFDEAVINLHIPFAEFADREGDAARSIAAECRSLVTKPGVVLNVSHDFVDNRALLDFLASNSLNAFFYEEGSGRGISSVIDHALAVDRPIAVSRSRMFRHLLYAAPSSCIDGSGLREILESDHAAIRDLREEWSAANMTWEYERIVSEVLARPTGRLGSRSGTLRNLARKVRHRVRAVRQGGDWIPDTSGNPNSASGWTPVYTGELADAGATAFNRILDDDARSQYAEVIQDLFRLVPGVMAKKIARANVQQAFVFDAVRRFAAQYTDPRILSVGSYEDTATLGLRGIGMSVREVDPVLNYDLDAFLDRPGTRPRSYDVILSTSVIEHVADDERFLVQLAELLAPGGVAILTCDFNDDYRPGDPLPAEDFRFYTQADLKNRLLTLLDGCELVDSSDWSCPQPDFSYAGCSYTFATLVFRRLVRAEAT